MIKRYIGESIAEAIDWAQDKLCTTRPVAESVLFSMITDKKITEGQDGFMLIENDEDDTDSDMKTRKQRRLGRRIMHRPRMNFGNRKRTVAERHELLRKKLRALGGSDEEYERLVADEPVATRSAAVETKKPDSYQQGSREIPHIDDADDNTATGLPRSRLPVGWT